MGKKYFEKKGLEIYNKLFGTAREYEKHRDQHLSMESRNMITIALLAALGRDHELKRQIKSAINIGIDKQIITEIITHVAHYAGWPAGQKGISIAQNAFEEKSLCEAKSSAEKRIVFCDFDGTITTRETFEGMFRIFVPHDAEKILKEIKDGAVSIRNGVKELLSKIESIYLDKIKKYYRECANIRNGFKIFIEFLSSNEVDFVIISGGLKEMVEVVLEEYGLIKWVNDKNIYGASVDDQGKYLDADCDFKDCQCLDSGELVPKVSAIKDYIVRNYKDAQLELVFIGDGQTDEIAAKSLAGSPGYAHYLSGYAKSSIVFARDALSESLKRDPYFYWNDFNDIHRCLAQRWQL